MSSGPLLEIRDLKKWYPARTTGFVEGLFHEQKYLRAVDGVSIDIREGEILGLAGQSGCGKSTFGEMLAMLTKPTEGDIVYDGQDVTTFSKEEMKQYKRKCQIIFQDPYESLNPRFSVGRIVREPLVIHGIGDKEERDERVEKALSDAGLKPPESFVHQLPSELSGGQRQRVSIARALVLEPDFLIADEPVSMLDVSISTGILNLFRTLQEERNLTIVYISHDLGTIDYLTDRTAIMYLGNIVELGPTSKVVDESAHPYTDLLLSAMPNPYLTVEREDVAMGDVPDAIDLPSGCRFRPDCAYATEKCSRSEPPLRNIDAEQLTACFYPINGKDYPEE